MQAGITPSVFLLTIFFSINLTLARRLPFHPQVNDLAGDFTSLILLETHAEPNIKFIDKAKALQAQLWADLDHAAVGAVQVLREINQSRGALYSHMPIVFTSTLTNNSEGRQRDESLTFAGEVIQSISQTPQVWLDHQVYEYDGKLIFAWDAIEEIFPPGMLDDMFQAYCCRLENLASGKETWDGVCPGILPPLHREVQDSANETAEVVSEELLHGIFERRATEAPDRVAVIAENCRLSYGELRLMSRRLGGELQAKGAVTNQLIAVVMEKGWEQVVATLGVLYAGAAYLPLDPNLPAERLAHILERAEVSLALTQSRVAERISWPAGISRIVVDRDGGKEETLLEVTGTQLEDLAYVIYTSGSTGQPKGVMIDHRGAVNTIEDINRRFKVTKEDRVFALSSLSFDLSVLDIFGTLSAGATIVIPPHCGIPDPETWLKWLNAEGVTVWNSVPALLTLISEQADMPGSTLSAPLRLVLLSGDWIPVSLPARMKKLVPGIEVVSLGGATEASIWSIYYPIGEVGAEWASIPYGKPLSNQRFYVLDESLEPRQLWVTGQLYIGGIGLAKGYWRDEEKTQASFIRHPRSGERLYKTGDLGRYMPDGNIEFLGREDTQVKVQGHRIELGEIEAALETSIAWFPLGSALCVVALDLDLTWRTTTSLPTRLGRHQI